MRLVVSAVVALHEDEVAVQEARRFELPEEDADRPVCDGDLFDVLRRHPAMVVAGDVHDSQVDEAEIGLLGGQVPGRNPSNGQIPLRVFAVGREVGEVERTGRGQVAELLPVVDERRFSGSSRGQFSTMLGTGRTMGTQVLVVMPWRAGVTPRNIEVWQGRVEDGTTLCASNV